jgi:plasmid stabilization system protein ParE
MAIVEFSEDARRMLFEADERWVAEHGLFAENPLIDEAEHATKLLADNPQIGKRYRRMRGPQPEIRRLLLATGWHLYYSVDATGARVQILAVWFASRGSDPAL